MTKNDYFTLDNLIGTYGYKDVLATIADLCNDEGSEDARRASEAIKLLHFYLNHGNVEKDELVMIRR